MHRPTNPYDRASNLMWGPFEDGVDAGRSWGREEKDEEWRERIEKLYSEGPYPDPGSDLAALSAALLDWFVKELLSGRDIE